MLDRVSIRFLGQSGVRVQWGRHVLYVDPCLSDYVAHGSTEPALWQRAYPPPLDPARVDDATAVLCTHEHADHLDPWTLGPLALASPEACLLVPAAAQELGVSAFGDSNRVVCALGECDAHELGVFRVVAVPAAHSLSYGVERASAGHRWLGYVIEVGGCRIYHAGDTVAFDGQCDAVLSGGPLDVVLLPINGRDSRRDRAAIVGNLWPREAADLALDLLAPVLIPMHFDLFVFNGIAAGQLADDAVARRLGLDVRILAAGASTTIPARH